MKIYGQGRTGYMLGAGVVYYNGDLGEKSAIMIPPAKLLNLYGKVGLSYKLSNRIEATLSYLKGSIEGADSLADEKDNKARNQSFKSPIDEISLGLEFNLNRFHFLRRANPFILAGGGIFKFNPKAYLDGAWYELQPVGTEGQYVPGGIYEAPYKLTQFDYHLGLGVAFQLADHWRLKLEFVNHFTFTDYLDDVSGPYPDSSLLAASPAGQLALLLSNRRLLQTFWPRGANRGNAKQKDSFVRLGLTLVYNPGAIYQSKKSGYGGKGINKGKRRKAKDNCAPF